MGRVPPDGGRRNITRRTSASSAYRIALDYYVSHPYGLRVSKARVEVQMPADVREMLRVLSGRKRQTASEWIRQAIVAAYENMQTDEPSADATRPGSGQQT